MVQVRNPISGIDRKPLIQESPKNANILFYGQKIGKISQGNYAQQFAESKLRNSKNFNSNESRN